MSRPAPAEPVKLIFSVLAVSPQRIRQTIETLASGYGQPDYVSPVLPFHYTDYYSPEMGGPLVRRFLSMERLICPDRLPDIKLAANEMETQSLEGGKRRINIDPGYLAKPHLILATGKGYTHRPYLRDGIYADLTLIYRKGRFHSLPWTYPDYADAAQQKLFEAIRNRYLVQLKTEEAGQLFSVGGERK